MDKNFDLDNDEKESKYSKYTDSLENQLNPGDDASLSKSYTQDYLNFKQDQRSKAHIIFEKLCETSHKILKTKVKQTDKDKIDPFLRLSHFKISADEVYSLAYFLGIISLISSVFSMLLLRNLLALVIGVVAFIFFLFYIPNYPKTYFIKWRAKASDQLVLAVMYLVIQMERVSNLELAVEFVARHTSPPISLDFMKILWDVESKKYSSVSDSLERYIQTWRGWNDDFIEAVHLVQFSLQQQIREARQETLNRATEVVLQGTQQHMLKYAHSLQGPMQALHMLGVVLPVMALVMLPMIGAFMGGSIAWYHLAIMYNILFPIMVYMIGKDMLEKRPSGTSGGDSYSFMRAKYNKPFLPIGNRKLEIPPMVIAALIFVVVSLPANIYFAAILRSYFVGTFAKEILFINATLLISLMWVLALGLSVGAYHYYSVYHLIKIKHKIERIESEFPSGVFQLANRIKEKIPSELAFSQVAKSMSKSDIGGLFWIIDYNLKKQGTDLKDAIFNEKYGAITYYPSGIIKSALSVLVDAAKKGPKSASKSLFGISTYLKSLKKVNERLVDLLAETTSSMKMQVSMFIPIITGLVIGLNLLITDILMSLGTVLSDIPGDQGAAGDPGIGMDLMSIFQFESMIPAFVCAVIVGIYIVQVVGLISYLVNGISNGYDTIEMKYLIGRNLLMAVPFYCIVSAIAALFLSNMISVMPV